MKKVIWIMFVLVQTIFAQEGFSQFGKVPDKIPEIFSFGFISSENQEHSALAFSPDGKEIYWSIWDLPYSKDKPQIILFTKYINGKWSNPEKVSFTGEYMDGSPVISPDGKRLYFYSNRPFSGNGPARNDIDIWYVKKTDSGWSKPINLEKVNTSNCTEAPGSFAANGNLYFSRGIKKGSNPIPKVDIYVSHYNNGIFQKPKKLSSNINTKEHRENYPFIAPDESFIIYASDQRVFSAEGKYLNGERYLSLSFNKNGVWSLPKKFKEEINGDGARFPSISPNGKYLFFTKYTEGPNEDFYWIDSKVINQYNSVSKQVSCKLNCEKKASLPEVRRNLSVIKVNNKIYAVGGREKKKPEESNLFEYDHLKNLWTEKNSMPTPRSNFQMAVLDGKIYAVGGDPFLNVNEVYDPQKNQWKKLSPLLTPRQHTAAAEANGKIYVFGGLESWEKISDKNEMFDPKTNSWISKNPMPTPRHGCMAVNIDNKIYVVGGSGTKNSIWDMHTIVEAYSPESDKWEKIANLPEPCLKPELTVVNNNIIAVASFNVEEKSNIYKYEPALNKWTKIGELPVLTRFTGITAVGNKIYVIGGCDQKFNPYDSVFEIVLDKKSLE